MSTVICFTHILLTQHLFCVLVIAIDIDPKKIEIARHNAELYGVADRIQFIIGDYFTLAPTLKADVVFLSPPWGGPDLMNLEEYKLSYIMPEKGGIKHMMSLTRQITSNIALHLPKNTNIFDVRQYYKFIVIIRAWISIQNASFLVDLV
jgi:23S rRNA G2445 N2-methylase RlmL